MWVKHGLWFWIWVAGALLVSVGFLVLLHFTSNQVKRSVTAFFTFLAGLFYVLEFFIPPDPATEDAILGAVNFTKAANTVGEVTQVVAGFTFLLGVYNLTSIHGRKLMKKSKDWEYSLLFFAAFLSMAVFAFWRDWETWVRPFGGKADGLPGWVRDVNPAHAAMPHDVYTFLFFGLWRNLEATMFSILAFYIVSAAYRAFRIRSREAAVLMIVAILMMLGQVPLGMALTQGIPPDSLLGIFRVEALSDFILKAINGPVQRAIGFGLGLGALAMALRIWLSLERGTYFGGDS